MFATILAWIGRVLPVIPGLIINIENLFSNKPKSGASKWIAVEQAISGSIEDVASEVAKLAPAGTTAAQISGALAVFSKDVNDSFVRLANDLQLFPHAGKPAANSGAPPAAS